MDGLCFPRDISYHGDPSITNLDLLIFGINYHLAFLGHNTPISWNLFKGTIGTNRLRYAAIKGWHDNSAIHFYAPFLSSLI